MGSDDVLPRGGSPGLRLFPSLAGYQRGWLRGDVVAGLTVWAVLVPEALAYASIAGVSPVVGLYAAPAALVLYAAFGSSRHLVAGPMSATAALSAAAVADLATQGSSQFVVLTVTLAITTGVIGVVAGLLRLGFLANFISEPVLKGFIIGLALTIVAGQLPKLFGVAKGDGNFFEQLWHLLGELGQTRGTTLLVGLLSLALVLLLRRVAPVVPGSLVAVLFGIVVVQLFALDEHGVDIVGKIDSGLPALGLPDVAAVDYLKLAPGAVGIVLVGFAAVVIAAVIELVDFPSLAALYQVYTRRLGSAYGVAARPDFVAAAAALARVLVFDTLPGLFIGIAMSLLLLIYRASRPHIAVLGRVPGTSGQYGDLERHPDNRQVPGVVILRVESGLFFANADAVRTTVRAHAATKRTRVVVLDAETVPFIDVTAVRTLAELADSLEREGVRLLLSRGTGQVRDVLRHDAADKAPQRVYPTVQAAVEAAQQPGPDDS